MNPAQSIAEIRARLEARALPAALVALRDFLAGKFSLADLAPLNALLAEHTSWLHESLPSKPVRLAILGGCTTQPIRLLAAPVLLAEGQLCEIHEVSFNTWRQEVLDPTSALHTFQPTLVLFALGSVNLEKFPAVGATDSEVAALANATVAELAHLWSLVNTRTGASVIQHTFDLPVDEPAGRLAARYAWSRTRYVASLNGLLWARDSHHSARMLDLVSASMRVGLDTWSDPRWYFHSKHGFNPALVPAYGLLLAGHLRAHFGRGKKCLVLDLDDTLWGGTVGDDGLDGLRLGPGSAEGEAFAAFCHYAKQLRARGVLLAVCSRNEPAAARAVFERHPSMPLRLADFAAFVCNWEPKSANLRTIAQDLNLGLDALVFMDNDSAICAEVRASTPEVRVVEAVGDPAHFPRLLDRLRLFETLDFTAEDLARPHAYAAQNEATALAASHTTHEDFLRDLAMIAEVRVATTADLPRVEQLFKKTNQFNLTGTTFGAAALSDPTVIVLAATLTDRLSAHGLIAAIVGKISDDTLCIENWVISCRVFSRTLEEFLLNHLVGLAQRRHARAVSGGFLLSGRNDYARRWLEKSSLLASPTEWRIATVSAPLTTFVRPAV